MIRWIYKTLQILVVLGVILWFPLTFVSIFTVEEAGGRVVLLLSIFAITCILLAFAGRYEKRADFKMGSILLCVPAVFAVIETGFFLSLFAMR